MGVDQQAPRVPILRCGWPARSSEHQLGSGSKWWHLARPSLLVAPPLTRNSESQPLPGSPPVGIGEVVSDEFRYFLQIAVILKTRPREVLGADVDLLVPIAARVNIDELAWM